MRNKTRGFYLLLISSFLCSCNENSSSSSNIESEDSSSVIESSSLVEHVKNYSFLVSQTKVILDSKTNTSFNISTVLKADGEECNDGIISYKSSNEQIASVNDKGQISFVSFGRCKIEVSWNIEKEVYKENVIVDCYEEVSATNINTFSSDYITTQGRVSQSSTAINLCNSASGIDMGFSGSELKMNIKGTSTNSYIHVYVDDDEVGKLIKITSTKEKEYVVAEGLENKFHTIRIIKATSPQYGNVLITGFTSDVTYYKAPKKDLTIEFLGDSISCGYGNLGTSAVSASSSNQDAGQAFPYLTSLQLDANFSVLALEGICAKDGTTNIYDSYTKYSTGSGVAYDPASYGADIVVIGLGENDMWHATSSQFTYTVDQFTKDYASLINLVRSYHPNAHIICMYGMMSASSTAQTTEVIEKAIKDSKDSNISSLKVSKNTDGSETHPNVKGHQSFAKKLTSKIKEYINKEE